MARHLADWLLSDPVLGVPSYPYDVAVLWGAASANGLVDERVVANVEEFNRHYAYPRLLAARPEDFFRAVERRFGPKLPVRRGDTGCYREDGAASTARELARYRAAQLAARAAELLALWDEKTEPAAGGASERIERRAEQRRQMWRDLLLFGEHTWGAATSVSDPDGEQTTAQWESKRRLLDRAAGVAAAQVAGALLRIGLSGAAGAGRTAPPRRPHHQPGRARHGPSRATAGHRRSSPGRAPAAGLHQRRDRRDAVRRAPLAGHREPDHQACHTREGSPVRRVSVRPYQAHRRGRGAPRPDDGGARPASRQRPGLVLPRALGMAARRGGRDAVERARHAARDAERHFPRAVAPHARARRNAVRLRAPQLLADELRGAAGRRFRVPVSSLGARPRERSCRAGAARVGRVRPAIRQRPLRERGRGAAVPARLGARPRGSRGGRGGRHAGRRRHGRGREARRRGGLGPHGGRVARGVYVPRRASRELRRDDRRSTARRARRPCGDGAPRLGHRRAATLYTEAAARLTIAI